MNYHAFETKNIKVWIQVAFHIPIPDEDNSASPKHNLRDCIVEHFQQKGVTITSVVPDIDAGELSELQSGALVEVYEQFKFSSANISDPQKRNEIRARYTELTTTKVDELRSQYKFWGYAENVP
jgi:hypothetical protein